MNGAEVVKCEATIAAGNDCQIEGGEKFCCAQHP
jgi:hypothetical protein